MQLIWQNFARARTMILRGANQDMERLPSVSELVPSDLLKNSIATPSQPSQPSPSQASSQARLICGCCLVVVADRTRLAGGLA